MKLRKIAAVLIAIVVLCAAVPNVVFAQDNFSFETAKTISLNTTTACMGNSRYVYYKFTINEPGYIEATIEHEYGSAGFNFSLYDNLQSDNRNHICTFLVVKSQLLKEAIKSDFVPEHIILKSRHNLEMATTNLI